MEGSKYKTDIEISIQYIGNSSFYISDGNHHIYIDYPYKSGAYNSMEYNDEKINHFDKGICMITHSHKDHWYRKKFSNYEFKIFAPKDITLLFHWHDITFYISGDTIDITHLEDLEDIDIAFVNPWILKELSRKHKKLDAACTILCHIKDGQQEDELLKKQNYIVMRQYETIKF